MDIAVRGLFFIVLIFTMCFMCADVEKAQMLKERIYYSTKASNQNSLLQIRNDENISTTEMLRNWIDNFVVNNSLSIEEIEFEFYIVNSNPECYLLKVKGYSDYTFINSEIYTEFVSGTMIITK